MAEGYLFLLGRIGYGVYIFLPKQFFLCQNLLFLHQLTHNMTTDCSSNYKFNTWKFQAQTCGEHVVYRNCFWHSEQFLYTTCSLHVLQKEELLTKIYLYVLTFFWWLRKVPWTRRWGPRLLTVSCRLLRSFEPGPPHKSYGTVQRNWVMPVQVFHSHSEIENINIMKIVRLN